VELILEEVWERTSQDLLRILDVTIGKLLSKFATIQVECEEFDFQKSCVTVNPDGPIFVCGAISGLGPRALHC